MKKYNIPNGLNIIITFFIFIGLTESYFTELSFSVDKALAYQVINPNSGGNPAALIPGGQPGQSGNSQFGQPLSNPSNANQPGPSRLDPLSSMSASSTVCIPSVPTAQQPAPESLALNQNTSPRTSAAGSIPFCIPNSNISVTTDNTNRSMAGTAANQQPSTAPSPQADLPKPPQAESPETRSSSSRTGAYGTGMIGGGGAP